MTETAALCKIYSNCTYTRVMNWSLPHLPHGVKVSCIHTKNDNINFCWSWDSLATKWPGYGLNGPWYNSWQGQETNLFSNMSRLTLGITQPPIQWALKFIPGCKADCSPIFSAEGENKWSHNSTPLYGIMQWTGTTLHLLYKLLLVTCVSGKTT